MKSVFNQSESSEIIDRINKLTPSTQPLWGKMSVGQMLAHCNVTYEYIYENKHKKPGLVQRLILKLFVKNIVVNEKAYKRNSPTGPDFVIKESKNFDIEKKRLIDFINLAQQDGPAFFDGKESQSFGPLNKTEWSNMMTKHLDHHLSQFGV